MNQVCSIHQPNFFPWLGYFDKIIKSDKFIFLDDVQFQKTGGSWTNRVKLYVANDARWVTAAIDRTYHGTRNINEMLYIVSENWREKFIRTLEMNYKKHPFYAETIFFFKDLINNPDENVAKYNMHAILKICHALEINTNKIQISSKLPHVGSSNELLCTLTKSAECNIYMCGGGADDYQEEKVFDSFGLKLIRQNFKHPTYSQKGKNDFTPGLSVIDAAMNIGWEQLSELLHKKPYE